MEVQSKLCMKQAQDITHILWPQLDPLFTPLITCICYDKNGKSTLVLINLQELVKRL